MPDIRMPDGIVVRFPDTMAPDEIKMLIADKFPSVAETKGVGTLASEAVRSLAEGATFGFSQELYSGIDALRGRGNYKELLAEKEKQDESISPAIRVPGQVSGAVLSTLAAAPVALPLAVRAGLTALPRALQYGGLGAVEGGLFGAGTAPSGEKVEGAATGAAVGAPVGVAAPYVAGGVARLANRLRGAVSPEANVAADLGRAIRRDDDTSENMLQRFQEHQPDRAGVIALGDVGGENVRGLVERVAQTPGAGRNIVVPRLTARQQEQANRIGADLRHLTGTNRTALQATQEVMAERATAARPLYQQAYREAQDGIMSPNLERMMSSDAVVRAMREAVTKGRDRSVTEGFGSFNPRVSVNENGVVRFVRGTDNRTIYPDLRFWDYTKRALDDAAGTAARAGRNDEAGVLRDLARQMRGELDTIVPSYRAARDAWAGPSAYLDAVEQGRNIMARNVSAEEMTAAFRGMSQAEQEGFRIGSVSSIVARMGNDPARLGDMTKYLRSPEMRAKIASIMPTPDAAQSWLNRLQLEVDSSELTGRALGNSATARRLAERADAEGLVGDLVLDAITGTPGVGILRRILAAGPRWLRDTLRARADRVLGDTLTNPNIAPGDVERILRGARQSGPIGGLPRAAATSGGVALTAP